mgnify:CR=1 FL=1
MRELTEQETITVAGGTSRLSPGLQPLATFIDLGSPGGLVSRAALSAYAYSTVHGQLGSSVSEDLYTGS